MELLRDKMVGALTFLFKSFEDLLIDACNIINNGSSANDTLVTTSALVVEAVKPIAWTILSIFFLVELYETWQRKQENYDFIDILKACIKLMICKSLIPVMPFLLNVIRSTTIPIYANLTKIDGTGFVGISSNIAESIINDYPNAGSILAIIGGLCWSLIQFVGGIVAWLALWAMGAYIYIIAYIRDFELAILGALSAFPIIFYVYTDTKDIPKRFLFAYGIVVLQGLVIMIIFILYQSMIIESYGAGMLKMILVTAIAFMAVKKSSEWAGKSLGQ